MARYIDVDALKLDIDLSNGATVVDMALSVIRAVKEAPTADVVPKSEVEELKADLEVWKQNRFNIFQMLELYKMTRQEAAKEIFEEIESNIYPILGLENDKEYVAILSTTFAELKKKYKGEE
jgi:hypothetical protein